MVKLLTPLEYVTNGIIQNKNQLIALDIDEQFYNREMMLPQSNQQRQKTQELLQQTKNNKSFIQRSNKFLSELKQKYEKELIETSTAQTLDKSSILK